MFIEIYIKKKKKTTKHYKLLYGGGVWFRSLFGTIADNHRNSTFGLNGTRVRFIFRSSISSECTTTHGIFSVSDN